MGAHRLQGDPADTRDGARCVRHIAIPSSKGVTTLSLDEEGGLCFDSLHPLRRYFFGVVLMTRFTLVVCLLCYGSLFLTVTVELGGLLLNAVALEFEFVISIDELLYEVLAPVHGCDI